MVKLIWRSDPIANPIGLEARIVEIDGEKILEARFSTDLTLIQKIRAIVSILKNKPTTISSIYMGG